MRLRRFEVVERNRESVLAAARRVFIEKGYSGATLETIAEAAGFSKGVMYSQFESKADLFLTLLERRIQERAAQNERIAAGATGAAQGVRKLLEVGSEDWHAEMAWYRLLIEFRVIAARDPAVNARYAAAHSKTLSGMASHSERLWAKDRLRPAVPHRVMAEFIQALVAGITLERIADPGALPLELVTSMVLRACGLHDSGS